MDRKVKGFYPILFMTFSARSLAFFALQRWLKTGELVSDTIRNHKDALSPADSRFAFELASGTIRRFWTLEWYATNLVTKRLPSHGAQKLLLFMALYQRLFHENIPPHALTFEYVELAKTVCNKSFASFVNALLRKSLQTPLALPNGTSPRELSIRYSYPLWFIERLVSAYGEEKTIHILEAENIQLPSYIRRRWDPQTFQFPYEAIHEERAGESQSFILQNPSQPTIFAALLQQVKPPLRILDLCAGSGGKSLMAWEVFHPQTLHAHDISALRLQRLQNESHKMGVSIEISCGDALNLPEGELFDLVLVDPPCSNSGVLFKCPEARHRLCSKTIRSHLALQLSLLKKARQVLAPHGAILYTTCSILPEENEIMISTAASELHLTIKGKPILILPDGIQFEGGFGALLMPISSCH